MKLLNSEQIKAALIEKLSIIEFPEQCALLDYPYHPNIGDHLIWLGEIFYLTDVLKTKVDYVASLQDFSPDNLKKNIGDFPIFLHGGGSLGDLWPEHQEFREFIISQYRDRPIIIFPQSIYFAEKENLNRASCLFNSHPNLTLFVRDNQSYNLAVQHFQNCQIVKAPDMAFQLAGMPGLSYWSWPSSRSSEASILYHQRRDKESGQAWDLLSAKLLEFTGLKKLIVEDWISYEWMSREKIQDSNLKEWSWKLPGSVKLFREIWQRRLAHPLTWIGRLRWQYFHPYSPQFQFLDCPNLHRRSWDLMFDGISQFNNYSLIITNRLHGHILSILLEKPHLFLPNSYYKNQRFYETWTSQIPFCCFIEDADDLQESIEKLRIYFERKRVSPHPQR